MKRLTLSLVCVLKDGVKRLDFLGRDRNRYAAMVAGLGEGEILQSEFSQKRDLKHNSKLHGVLGEVADALGWEAGEFKEYIVGHLRPGEECPITGHIRRQSTAAMTDEEIDQLVLEIKAWTHHHMPGFVFQFDEQFTAAKQAARAARKAA